MEHRSLLTRTRSFVIGALIIVMALGGTVAFTPRYVFWGRSDFGCCTDPYEGHDWLGIFLVVPFVVAVAVVLAMLKSWLDDRANETPQRLL